MASALDQHETAAQLFSAADEVVAPLGTPFALPERAHHERTKERVRGRLGDAAFARSSREGRALGTERAVDEAKAALAAAGSSPATAARGPSEAGIPGLPPREAEVLRLVAAGLSDREIAEALSVSPRTVGGHVAGILGKLGVASRAAAAAHAVRRGLV